MCIQRYFEYLYTILVILSIKLTRIDKNKYLFFQDDKMLEFLKTKNGEDVDAVQDVKERRKTLIENVLNRDRAGHKDHRGLFRPAHLLENHFADIQAEVIKAQWSEEESKKAMKKLSAMIEELGMYTIHKNISNLIYIFTRRPDPDKYRDIHIPLHFRLLFQEEGIYKKALSKNIPLSKYS